MWLDDAMEGLPAPRKGQGLGPSGTGLQARSILPPLTDWLTRMEKEAEGEFCQGDTFIH